MAISREGTYLTSECDRSTRVGGTRRNKLPTVKEDGCLVAVVENRGHFKVVVEVISTRTLQVKPLKEPTLEALIEAMSVLHPHTLVCFRGMHQYQHPTLSTLLMMVRQVRCYHEHTAILIHPRHPIRQTCITPLYHLPARGMLYLLPPVNTPLLRPQEGQQCNSPLCKMS